MKETPEIMTRSQAFVPGVRLQTESKASPDDADAGDKDGNVNARDESVLSFLYIFFILFSYYPFPFSDDD